MKIENDNGVSDLLASSEEQRLCTGFQFTEGPLWVPSDTCLLFSDIPGDTIYRWRPGNDEAEVYRQPAGYPNGLTLDGNGNLLVCEHGGRRVSIAPYDSDSVEPLAEAFDGKRLNSPNDIVVSSTGAVYFTDPDSGLRNEAQGGSGEQELDHLAVYRIATNGAVQQMITELDKPNGLAFSPNESLIFVSDSLNRKISRYTVFADGTLSSRGEMMLDVSKVDKAGTTDGMKVDTDGRIWTTVPGGVCVFETEGTEVTILGTFSLEEQPSNLAWGGPDFSTLYLTAQTSVYAVETNVRGVAPGSGA